MEISTITRAEVKHSSGTDVLSLKLTDTVCHSLSQPVQGNDNRSTSAWLPKSSVAPSANWNSTYGVHYKNPAKRFSKNHDYWLKKAALRIAAQNAAAQEQLAYDAQFAPATRGSQTYREQPFRNPSSMSRAGSSGVLTARPLSRPLVDTSFRHFDAFDRSQAQRFYQPAYDVSALRVLEGQAAGAHASFPLQATSRPAAAAAARQQRPQTAGPLRQTQRAPAQQQQQQQRQQVVYAYDPAAATYASPSNQAAWPVYEAKTDREGNTIEFNATGEAFEPRTLRAYALASPQPQQQQQQYYDDSRVRTTTVGRSQTFRPQLSSSQSTPVIPANVLLNVAAAPDRYERRTQDWQGGGYRSSKSPEYQQQLEF